MESNSLRPHRKSPQREHGNSTRFIPNNLPYLSTAAKDVLVRQWRFGIPIRQISQNQGLTQPQVESVIWERFAGNPHGPSVRESRRIHLIKDSRAA